MKYYQRKKGLISKKIGREFIVIDTDTESFYVLNETAETIYRFLHEKRRLAEIIKKIASRYEVDSQKSQKDVLSFLQTSAKHIFTSI